MPCRGDGIGVQLGEGVRSTKIKGVERRGTSTACTRVHLAQSGLLKTEFDYQRDWRSVYVRSPCVKGQASSKIPRHADCDLRGQGRGLWVVKGSTRAADSCPLTGRTEKGVEKASCCRRERRTRVFCIWWFRLPERDFSLSR
ncbi:unnamed protein product [Hapterophycus canaliculatus]